jgi:hypothetical protein
VATPLLLMYRRRSDFVRAEGSYVVSKAAWLFAICNGP